MQENIWKGAVITLSVSVILMIPVGLIAYGRLTEQVSNYHNNFTEFKRLVETQAALSNKNSTEIRNRQIRVEVISEHMLKTLNNIDSSMTTINANMNRNEGIIEAAKEHIRHK